MRLNIPRLAVAKTNNLQPYLFRKLQEGDAGAEVEISIRVRSEPGISEDVLTEQIVKGLEMLGIAVDWQEG